MLGLAEARGLPLADEVAHHAWETAARVLSGSGCELEVVVFDRSGGLAGLAPFRRVG